MDSRQPEREMLASPEDVEHYSAELKKKACCLTNKVVKFVKTNLMLILTFAGIILGFSSGFVIREIHPSTEALTWIGMPGELFLRILKLLILPLIVCSVISGSAGLDPKSNGKISAISFVYILLTNILGCVLGVVLCLILKPGDGDMLATETKETVIMETQDIFSDLLRNIFPDNLIKATFVQYQTVNTVSKHDVERNTTNGTVLDSVQVINKSHKETGGTNVLGLIAVCTLIGIAASRLKKQTKVFIDFFNGGMEVFLQILRWFLWITPIGITSLIAVSIANMTTIGSVFEQLGMFVVTVTLGIVIQQLIILPLLLFVFTRRNPYLFLITIARPWMMGLATTSTAVAIPEMLNACEVKNNIDKRVSRFVIPFCVTLNSDGSAFYISTAAVFIANLTGTHLSVADYIVICILTGMATLALPSIPSSSIVTLVMVLTSLNIPAGHISLLFAVEWYLDRIRTTSNIVSHTYCTAITYQFCKNDLKKLDEIPCDDIEIEIESPLTAYEMTASIETPK